MNAETELAEAYQEWRRIAETEGEAIRDCEWGLVTASQSALEHLQARINSLTEAARNEWKQLGTDVRAKEKKFRALVSDLIHIEHRNNALLDAVRKAALAQREELDQSSHNLRRIQHSYVFQRPAAWTSYS